MNNTDKQLLIDAALAVGIESIYEEYHDDGMGGIVGPFYWYDENTHMYYYDWNPLDSNVDAFKLMVDLGLSIDISDQRIYAIGENENTSIFVECGSDEYAATRRAIVMAAADNYRSGK